MSDRDGPAENPEHGAPDDAHRNANALDPLRTRLYEELKAIAASYIQLEPKAMSLSPTGLVHEAWLKLARPDRAAWNGAEHFKATAARAMRNILVDHARRRNAEKRGGHLQRVSVSSSILDLHEEHVDLEILDLALTRLEEKDGRAAQVVEMRFFGDLGTQAIAEHLGVSERTVHGDWEFAKVWLAREIGRLQAHGA